MLAAPIGKIDIFLDYLCDREEAGEEDRQNR